MVNLLVKTFIKNSDDIQDTKVRNSYGILGGAVGIVCNVFLFITKFMAGMITGAISITADAFNNLSDAFSSIVTMVGFKMSEKPPDPGHPFGHGRIEYLAGLFVSVAIIMVSVDLFKSSVEKIFHPTNVEYTVMSVIILIVSVVLKLWIGYFNNILGKKINSATMKATATDSMSDCIATTVVLLSIAVSHFTTFNVEGYAGAIVAIFVLFAGIGSIKDTIQPLLGTPPSAELVGGIKELVLSHNEIVGIHDLVVHDYGPGRMMVSLHAEIPYTMDIMVAHDVIDNIECELDKKFHCESTIHLDPIDLENETTKIVSGEVERIVKEISKNMTIHDFRMTQGIDHQNLIFDVVVPTDCKIPAEEIKVIVDKKCKEINSKYNTVIKVDQPYI
ncbi:MAG: cation diffusion facilitator family transporter [Oscillospiraceae bacterium]